MDAVVPDQKKSASAPKEFVVSDDLREMAERIIREHKLDFRPAQVEYLLVYPNIQKTVAGKCIKTGKELKFFTGHDYLVEISGDLWDSLDDSVRYVLLLHELLHIMPVMNEKTGEWKMKLRQHDIMDFSYIIKQHGTEWIDQVKLSISSIYDMGPAEQDRIKI